MGKLNNYEPKQGEKIFVYGGPEALGAWDKTKAHQLQLHTIQPPPHIHGGRIPPKVYTFEGQVDVLETEGKVEYKYLSRLDGVETEEPGSKHGIHVEGMGGSRQKC